MADLSGAEATGRGGTSSAFGIKVSLSLPLEVGGVGGAVTSITSTRAGPYGKVRKHLTSRILRDNYKTSDW